MAIGKLDFSRSSVTNPFVDLGDSLIKTGAHYDQLEQQRIANERQAKLDARAEELWNQQQQERQASQYMMGELAKGRQIANNATMWNAADKNPQLFDKLAILPTDTPEQIAAKTKQQEAVGKLAITPTADMMETNTQQLGRVLKDTQSKYSGYIPGEMFKEYRAGLLADTIAQQQKEKEIASEQKALRKESQRDVIEMAKAGLKAHGGGGGGLTLGDDGDVVIGSANTAGKVLQHQIKTAMKENDAFSAGVAAIDKAISDKVTKDKLSVTPEDIAKIKENATSVYKTLLSQKADPADAAHMVSTAAAGSLTKDPTTWNPATWFGPGYKTSDIALDKNTQDALLASGKRGKDLENALMMAMMSNGRVGNGANFGEYAALTKNLIKENEKEYAKLEAEKLAARLSPEERQANSLASKLGAILTPTAASTVPTAKNSVGTSAFDSSGVAKDTGSKKESNLQKLFAETATPDDGVKKDTTDVVDKSSAPKQVATVVTTAEKTKDMSPAEKTAYYKANMYKYRDPNMTEQQFFEAEKATDAAAVERASVDKLQATLNSALGNATGQRAEMRLINTLRDEGKDTSPEGLLHLASITKDKDLSQLLSKAAKNRVLENPDPKYDAIKEQWKQDELNRAKWHAVVGAASAIPVGGVLSKVLGRVTPEVAAATPNLAIPVSEVVATTGTQRLAERAQQLILKGAENLSSTERQWLQRYAERTPESAEAINKFLK